MRIATKTTHNYFTDRKTVKKVLIVCLLICSLFVISFLQFRDQIIQGFRDNIIIRTHVKSTGVAGVNRQTSPLSILGDLYHNISNYHKYKTSLETITIDIKFADFLKLQEYRKYALEDGMINRTHLKYVNAKIKIGEKKVKAKIRLKGWYLDHLATKKWSFKIKILNDHIKGKKSFTLNAPHTKDFHSSMIINNAMRYKGILAPTDNFFNVIINGKKIGKMYFEESYSEQFTENSFRPYGPILYVDEKSNFNNKFVETRQYWDENLDLDLIHSNIKYILNEPSKHDEFINHELWAEYLAITFLFKCYHGNLSLNLAHYFHPLLKKIEPISSDNACGQKASNRVNGYLPRERDFVFRLIKIPSFNELLKTKVKWWLQNEEAKKYLTKLKEKENRLRWLLAKEAPFIQKFIIETDHLSEVLIWLDKKNQIPKDLSNKKNNITEKKELILPLVKITKSFDQFNVEINKYSSNRYILQELVVEFFEKKERIKLIPILSNMELSQKLNKILNANSFYKVKKIYFSYRDKNRDNLTHNNGVNLHYSEPRTHPFKKTKNPQINNIFDFDRSNNRYFLKDYGKVVIENTLVLPEQASLYLGKGSQIKFKNNAGLVVKGDFLIDGTFENEVNIEGLNDNEWSGILILGDGGDVSINYLNFKGGTGLINGYSYRGALTINKAQVFIKNSRFSENTSEDLLNLVESEGVLENISIQNTKSDGLDIDYGKIDIIDSKFYNIGSSSGADAIDVSKSRVNIKNLILENITDKGISVGENSYAVISNVNVKSALVGLVSKDSSTVKANNINLQEIKFADTMSYQKKTHFGGSRIEVSNLSTNLNKYITQINSTSSINGLDIEPEKIDVEILYSTLMDSIK